MSESIVSIQNLVKRYGAFTAVNGADLEVRRGEVFGLLGPNGAGKTTTLECLEGMRRADAGHIRIAGCDPFREASVLRKKLGVQLQSSSLPEYILVGEALELTEAWSSGSAPEGLIEEFGLQDLMKKQYRQLSTGQKRRLNLALALVKNPEVVVLDEPTAGLDVQSRALLHDKIRKIRAQGVTVLLATHDMAEAEDLCDRIAILLNGKIAVCGTPEEVTAAGNQETRIRLRTARGSLLPGSDLSGAAFVREKDGYLEWKCRDLVLTITELFRQISDREDSVDDLRVERPSLEERFLELVKGA
ncbi:ABC transporter ATP-binding protein [Caproicibacter fermentans]|uniref:ABC transporter ATP-binding protein n=1 Tax=Caproicibacter fermentans TaxID=2576756 RepID=UPI001E62DA46|nr:ABC transporter ATP-binding protein [Caproicibacter fermentans]